MPDDKIASQLIKPTSSLLTGGKSNTVTARDTGHVVGKQVFDTGDPDALVSGIFNMEAYYHSLREAALAAVQQQLAERYRNLATVIALNGGIEVQLNDGKRQTVPTHTSPHLAEFVMLLDPADGCNDPGICLKLLQQAIRLLEVLGMSDLSLKQKQSA